MVRERWRLLFACLATAALLGPLIWFWQASLVPTTYSVMDMGYLDYGGGPGLSMGGHDMAGTSVTDLREASKGPPDVEVDLVARQERFTLASGRQVEGYTLNGVSPGPMIRARQGDLVEVRVTNESVSGGMTLHWHGVDVPNAEDGVAGVTQDAIGEGESYVYRFVPRDAGTYWYHSHQVSNPQVIGGLLGPLVVDPDDVTTGAVDVDVDVTAVAHNYSGIPTVNGLEGELVEPARPGDTARVRVVNTDNAPLQVWASTPYRVLAIDGFDLNEPTPVSGKRLVLTAGGRVDLEVTVPTHGQARVQLGGASTVVIGDESATPPPAVERPEDELDLLTYGSPAPIGFDPEQADRNFDYIIDRRPGFVDGRPGMWWTINGHKFPDVPMFVVREGDIVRMTVENRSGEVHPMHLHGHHAVVLSRNGEESTGSPWWVDSLNVESGESYDIALVADNPGVWMDHCHNLRHASDGLVAHLMYDGVSTPYMVGGESHNTPE